MWRPGLEYIQVDWWDVSAPNKKSEIYYMENDDVSDIWDGCPFGPFPLGKKITLEMGIPSNMYRCKGVLEMDAPFDTRA